MRARMEYGDVGYGPVCDCTGTLAPWCRCVCDRCLDSCIREPELPDDDYGVMTDAEVR